MATEFQSAHTREADVRQLDALRQLGPQGRLKQALRMSRAMRELLAAGYRQRFPAWSQQQVAEAVAARILHARTG